MPNQAFQLRASHRIPHSASHLQPLKRESHLSSGQMLLFNEAVSASLRRFQAGTLFLPLGKRPPRGLHE
jgi:hypothetical protein